MSVGERSFRCPQQTHSIGLVPRGVPCINFSLFSCSEMGSRVASFPAPLASEPVRWCSSCVPYVGPCHTDAGTQEEEGQLTDSQPSGWVGGRQAAVGEVRSHKTSIRDPMLRLLLLRRANYPKQLD